MYDILDLYETPYDPKNPVIVIDEKPIQLIDHIRKPIPTKQGKIAKQDYEYKRNGTANIFIGVEFKAGKRITKDTKIRTKKHYARFAKRDYTLEVHVDHLMQITSGSIVFYDPETQHKRGRRDKMNRSELIDQAGKLGMDEHNLLPFKE
ncbi:hypothetical protein GF327_01090 [Candidatus Woesearchaeota archaeon]|nr:hypothetical protein [Candidatus Woesearchaeota archaeon]